MRGAGRSIPTGLPVNDPPQPSRLQGFLSGRGGSAVRGKGAQPGPTISNVVASTSSGGRSGLKHLLPSFSSDDDEMMMGRLIMRYPSNLPENDSGPYLQERKISI